MFLRFLVFNTLLSFMKNCKLNKIFKNFILGKIAYNFLALKNKQKNKTRINNTDCT